MATAGNEAVKSDSNIHIDRAVRVVLVKTEWNAHITDELENGALRILAGYPVVIESMEVPGAVEIPHAISYRHRAGQQPDAYIAFACIIRGDTPHFDYVCQSVTQGITLLNIQLTAPVIYGVLTVNTEEQALERIGGIHGHKGEEAAITALKMMMLKQKMEKI